MVLCARCWWQTRTTFISNTCSNRFKHFHPLINLSLTHGALSILSQHTTVNFHSFHSFYPKKIALRHVVFRWCNLGKERPCFRPRCCHSTEGRALYCTWLNSSTGTVITAQCASSSLSRLPRNLKIAFTFWFTLVYKFSEDFFPAEWKKEPINHTTCLDLELGRTLKLHLFPLQFIGKI